MAFPLRYMGDGRMQGSVQHSSCRAAWLTCDLSLVEGCELRSAEVRVTSVAVLSQRYLNACISALRLRTALQSLCVKVRTSHILARVFLACFSHST